MLGSMATDLTLLAYTALHAGQRETAAAAYHAATRMRVAYRQVREGIRGIEDIPQVVKELDDDLVLIEASIDGATEATDTCQWLDAIKGSRDVLISQ